MEGLEVIRAPFGEYEASIRAIRMAVFVGEQGVPPELEMDGRDLEAVHALAFVAGRAVGTGRLLQDGHIGRVAVLPEFRGQGVGVALMGCLMTWANELGMKEVALASQARAVGFYESLGFRRRGAPYVEAGIDHVDMKRPV